MATEVPTMRRTPLYGKHAELGAKMVPFAGYEMPIQYEGIVAEHRAVRSRAGLFDLSHMGEFFFTRGADAALDRLVSSDIAGLAVGQARYDSSPTSAARSSTTSSSTGSVRPNT
jgi:glycine cleavage system T protein (aminomethyltransferase)